MVMVPTAIVHFEPGGSFFYFTNGVAFIKLHA